VKSNEIAISRAMIQVPDTAASNPLDPTNLDRLFQQIETVKEQNIEIKYSGEKVEKQTTGS